VLNCGVAYCPGTVTLLAVRSVTKDILNWKNSAALSRVTLCSWNTIGYRVTCNEAADGVLQTPGLEFMKNGVYVVSNPWIFEVDVKKGSEWSPYSSQGTQFFRKGFWIQHILQLYACVCVCVWVCLCVCVCVCVCVCEIYNLYKYVVATLSRTVNSSCTNESNFAETTEKQHIHA